MKSTTKFLMSLPAITLLAACASGGSNSTGFGAENIPNAQDKRAPQTTEIMTPVHYTCGEAGSAVVEFTNSSVVRLTATFPELQLQNRSLRLYRQVSASGELYVDSLNPNSTIEWHTKGNEALFAVQWKNGRNYQANCIIK